jgi:hypothetical protein
VISDLAVIGPATPRLWGTDEHNAGQRNHGPAANDEHQLDQRLPASLSAPPSRNEAC